MPYVKKITTGLYECRFRVDGKQYSRRVSAPTKSDCMRQLAEIIRKIESGERNVTWSVGFRHFEGANRLATISNVKQIIDSLIACVGDIPVSETPRDKVARFLLEKSESLSPSTADKYKRNILSVARWLRKFGFINDLPFEHLPTIRKQPKKRRAIPADRVIKYIDCCPEHLRPIVMFLAVTGLRSGAVCSICEADVTDEYVRVREKGGKVRDVLRDEYIAAAIEAGRAHKAQVGSTSTRVFVTAQGRGWSPSAVVHAYKLAQAKAGLPYYTPHELRHTLGTMAGKSGATVDQIKATLGHASRKTSEIYTHLDEDTARDIRAKIVPAIFNANPSKNVQQFLQQNNSILPLQVGKVGYDKVFVSTLDGSQKFFIDKGLLCKALSENE